MRTIPKNTKIKNTVWRQYSVGDALAALAVLTVVFVSLTAGKTLTAGLVAVAGLAMFAPAGDGVFYVCVLEAVRFLFSAKRYGTGSGKEKRTVRSLTGLRSVSADGLLEYGDGSFGRAVRLGQKNFGMEDEETQNADIERFAEILKSMDLTQAADLVKIERPVNLDAFSEDLFKKVERLRENPSGDPARDKTREKILRSRLDRIDGLNNLDRKFVPDFFLVFYGRNAEDLERLAADACVKAAAAGLPAEIAGAKETAVMVRYLTRPSPDETEAAGKTGEELAEWALPERLEFLSGRYRADGAEHSVLCVSDYPLRVGNAWGASLFDLPGTSVSMRFTPVDGKKAERRIDRCVSEMETRRLSGEKASEVSSAETHRESMAALLAGLQTENEILLDVSAVITVREDGEGKNRKAVRNALRAGGFRVSALHGLQREGFRTAFVSPDAALKKHVRGINSSSAAAVFPFVRTAVLDRGGIYLGENAGNGYPFILNIWKRDSLYQNSNAAVSGRSGSGKSWFLKTLAVNEWSDGVRIMILDPEAEYTALARNLRGTVIDAGSSSGGRVNPFHVYKILTEDGVSASPETTFNSHLKTLESFFRIVLAGASPDVLELVNDLAVETYARKGITESTDCSALSPEDFPLFSDMLETLYAKTAADPAAARDARTAELYLKKFVSGRYSDIWNAPSTLEADNEVTVFDFRSLFSSRNDVVANAQMLLIFRFIEQEVINGMEANRGGRDAVRTMIICDEAHLFTDPDFPVSLDFFRSMSRRIRKYEGSFIPATQSVSDFNAGEEVRAKTAAVLKNSQYSFIFRLSAPDMKDAQEIYSAGGGFNPHERRTILSAATGQAFFSGSPELRACVRIRTDAAAAELFGEGKTEEDDVPA